MLVKERRQNPKTKTKIMDKKQIHRRKFMPCHRNYLIFLRSKDLASEKKIETQH